MNHIDHKTAEQMALRGGNFVRHLGLCACAADADNLERLKEAFPELWTKYEAMIPADERRPA